LHARIVDAEAHDDESIATTIGPARSTIATPNLGIPLSGTPFLFFHAYWAESQL